MGYISHNPKFVLKTFFLQRILHYHLLVKHFNCEILIIAFPLNKEHLREVPFPKHGYTSKIVFELRLNTISLKNLVPLLDYLIIFREDLFVGLSLYEFDSIMLYSIYYCFLWELHKGVVNIHEGNFLVRLLLFPDKYIIISKLKPVLVKGFIFRRREYIEVVTCYCLLGLGFLVFGKRFEKNIFEFILEQCLLTFHFELENNLVYQNCICNDSKRSCSCAKKRNWWKIRTKGISCFILGITGWFRQLRYKWTKRKELPWEWKQMINFLLENIINK